MYGKTILPAALLLMLTSCATFALVEKNFEPRGSKLAVVSGLNDDTNHYLAHSMTEAFQKHSTFKVVSQKAVQKAIPDYPVNIKGPYRAAYFNIEPDYSQTDTKRINDIQKKLGVDYLYVLWSPSMVTHNRAVNSINIIGQMFEFPSGKEVGHGRFNAVSKVKGRLVIGVAAKDEAAGIAQATDRVAAEIAMKMKMSK